MISFASLLTNEVKAGLSFPHPKAKYSTLNRNLPTCSWHGTNVYAVLAEALAHKFCLHSSFQLRLQCSQFRPCIWTSLWIWINVLLWLRAKFQSRFREVDWSLFRERTLLISGSSYIILKQSAQNSGLFRRNGSCAAGANFAPIFVSFAFSKTMVARQCVHWW